MAITGLEIQLPSKFDLRLTALSHGWVNLAPFKWDSKKNCLERKEHVDGKLFDLAVTQKGKTRLKISISHSDNAQGGTFKCLKKRIRRALNVDFDTSTVYTIARNLDPEIGKLIEMGGGRFLRGTTLFEDTVKTLFTTNASWSFTQKMVENLIREFGIGGAFPESTDLRRATEKDFRERLRIGYRSKYLIGIVKMFNAKTDECELVSKSIPGLGDYGLTHLKMLTNDFSSIPIDSEVRSYCKKAHGCQTDKGIKTLFAPWENYAFLGYKLGRQIRKENWIGEKKRGRD